MFIVAPFKHQPRTALKLEDVPSMMGNANILVDVKLFLKQPQKNAKLFQHIVYLMVFLVLILNLVKAIKHKRFVILILVILPHNFVFGMKLPLQNVDYRNVVKLH